MKKLTLSILIAASSFAICALGAPGAYGNPKPSPSPAAKGPSIAVFAGGCFWCMSPPFDALKGAGVTDVTVGYTGGTTDAPTYEEVSTGFTGHRESVQIKFDPSKITYEKLLSVFWANIDPLDAAGQFCDKGSQYKSAIFYQDEAQRKAAEASKVEIQKKLEKRGKIATDILPAKRFWPAEEYHQEFYLKNPSRYQAYKSGCKRQEQLKSVWGSAPAH